MVTPKWNSMTRRTKIFNSKFEKRHIVCWFVEQLSCARSFVLFIIEHHKFANVLLSFWSLLLIDRFVQCGHCSSRKEAKRKHKHNVVTAPGSRYMIPASGSWGVHFTPIHSSPRMGKQTISSTLQVDKVLQRIESWNPGDLLSCHACMGKIQCVYVQQQNVCHSSQVSSIKVSAFPHCVYHADQSGRIAPIQGEKNQNHKTTSRWWWWALGKYLDKSNFSPGKTMFESVTIVLWSWLVRRIGWRTCWIQTFFFCMSIPNSIRWLGKM